MANELKSNISMVDTVKALSLHVAGPESDLCPIDVTDVNILCPQCSGEHQSHRLTLNINFEENVFHCPRCGFGGGPYKLISAYTKWPINEVEKKVRDGELKGYSPSKCGKESESGQEEKITPARPLAPLARRDEVYRHMLRLLTLSEEHRKNLLSRGLSQNDIETIGFKSVPKFLDETVIAKKLMTAGLDLRGVPGFYINEAGNWTLKKQPSGFLIPNRNGQGLIQGFQIRFDHPPSNMGKYGYLSSGNKPGGTKCGTWCCWAGISYETMQKGKPFDVILIEGSLKAYIVNAKTGVNVTSVPGVTALNKVLPALQEMQKMGLSTVYIAYDMDSYVNRKVAEQLARLRGMLNSVGIKHKTLKWNPQYKGLDDYLTESGDIIC